MFINSNHQLFLVLIILILGIIWIEAETCSSCGSECQSACGTRHFRTCCFNYLKKRSDHPLSSLSLDPSLKLELWLAKSRYHQPIYSIIQTDGDDTNEENEIDDNGPINMVEITSRHESHSNKHVKDVHDHSNIN